MKKIIRDSFEFFMQILQNRVLLLSLAKRDFERKYVRNFFGMLWAILDPMAFVLIMYFVFGPRYGDAEKNGVPFVLYLLSGYIAFELFQNSIQSLTKSVSDHAFLVRKVNFQLALLPLVVLISRLMMHAIVLGFCLVLILFHGILPSLYWFQVLYYVFALSVLLISTAWFTSSIFLFFGDIENIISIITRVMFFLTPIFWNIEGLDKWVANALKLNPLYYILTGYRESLLLQKGFWTHPWLTAWYWGICCIMLVIGVLVFKKLRPHFADVVA